MSAQDVFVTFDGLPVDMVVEARASALDRAWFAARPARKFRLRPRLAGELGAAPAVTHILVEQIRPGARWRRSVIAAGALPLDDDAQLGRLAAALRAGDPAPVVHGLVGRPGEGR